MANLLTLRVVLFASLGSWTWGYVAGIIASTLGQPSFIKYMSLEGPDAPGLIGTINALFSVGGFLGCFLSVWINENHGRLWGIFAGCVAATIGSALSAGSVNLPMFIVARCITGVGIGDLLVLVPLYQSEITPHTHRGLFVGLHGVSLCVGYVCSNWIGYGFFFVTNQAINWRLPLAIGGVPAAVLAASVFVLPQSPRYLVQQDRIDEALAVVRQLRFEPSEPDSLLYRREHAQMVDRHEIEKTSPSSWISMFTVAHYRRRCVIGHLTFFFVQASGNLVITNYAPSIYGRLGFNANKQLLMAGAWITLCPFGNMLNAWLLDIWGRRPLLSGGLMGCVLCLVAEAISVARFTATGNTMAAHCAVAFLFLHMVFFSSTQDASSYVYGSEIFPTHIRAKGMAISVAGLFTSTLLFVSAAPAGFEHIGWRYYMVLAVPAFVGSILEWRYWPASCSSRKEPSSRQETKDLTLEEIGRQFGDPVAHSLDPQYRLEDVHETKGNISEVEHV